MTGLQTLVVLALCICISARPSSALYLTQDNYAPCSFITSSSIRILDCSSRGLNEVPGVERSMSVSAFYLDGNPIPSIGANAFANLSSSLTFLSVTSTALMDRIDNLALAGLTTLTSLTIEAKEGSEVSMNKVNIDKLLSGLKALTSIRLSKVNINELPISFGGGTNMANVSFIRTAIATIDVYAFSNASNLRFLDLSNNPLNLATRMNWLGSAGNLETVTLSACGIATDTMGQMPSVPKLRRLDLKSNKLTRLDSNSLVNIAASLEELVLNSNEISDGSTHGLASLLALRELFMVSNTLISAIPPEVKQLSVLEVLDLRGTRVAGIEADSFHTSSKLKTLKLDYTNVHSFHALAFARAANLEEFTVSAGSLSTSAILDTAGVQQPGNWSVILAKIPRLRVLSLSGIGTNTNEIGGIKNSIWSSLRLLPNLQRLSLEYNSISAIPDFYLSSFGNLSYVNLGNNNISSLTSAAMYGMENVQVLLQTNRLSYMDNCTLAMYKKLDTVSLGGNPFYCGCAMQWLWQRVHTEIAINLASMECSQPAALAGRTWHTLSASDFCAAGETAPNNCSVQVPTTATPTTTSFPFLLEITVSKASELTVRLEANFAMLVGQFSGYFIKYWSVSQPEVVFNTSLMPMTSTDVTLKVTVNEKYRYCYVLLNGSSWWVESGANCRDFTLTGLASAAVIAISVLAAIIGVALIFVVVCLVCKKLRHRQSAQMKGQAEEDPYAYVYPDEKQVGKPQHSQSQFQATLRPESKRFSKRSRPNLAGSRPSLATSTTTLATPRMSDSGFAIQNGARPVSGHSMVQQQHQNPMLQSDGVQPSQSMHSIAHDPRSSAGQHTQQQLSRSQDHLSSAASVRGNRELPPPPRQARSQELVLDVSQAAGRYKPHHQYLEQPPSLPPPRSRLPPSISGQQLPQAFDYTQYSGDGAYLPMSSAAAAYLGESSTDTDQRLQQPVSPTYNAYLPDDQLQQELSQPGRIGGGVDNSAFQRHETSGYYEMGQF